MIMLRQSAEEKRYFKGRTEDYNLIGLYLREISRYPLLKKDEEVELFKRLEKESRYAYRTSNRKRGRQVRVVLSRTEEGVEIKKRIIESNLKLVVSIAKNYSHNGDLLGLIEEGNLSLLKAVDTFEYKRGYKFSTYASWCIKQTINRYRDYNSSFISKSSILYKRARKLKKEAEEKEISFEQLCEKKGISRRPIQNLTKALNSRNIYSIYGEFEDNPADERLLASALISHKNLGYDILQKKEYLESLLNLFINLKSKNKRDIRKKEKSVRVLRMRYGLDGKKPMTLRAIAGMFHLTRERIRQIQIKTERTIRKITEREDITLPILIESV